MPPIEPSAIDSLRVEQRELEARLHGLDGGPRQVLALGEALLSFAVREDVAFSVLSPLLDPAARAELSTDHRQIAEDLGLLEWLVGTTPDSPDVAALSASLVRRMRQHIERDGRLLDRAARFAPR